MKRGMTLSEQKERETLASRVYAATVSWQAAAEQRDAAKVAEREAWKSYADLRDAYAWSRTHDLGAVKTARLVWEHAEYCWEQAESRHAEAWAEREAALKANADFTARMDSREDVCDNCGDGEVAHTAEDGELLCADCYQSAEHDWREVLAEQERDYYRAVCGGLDNGNLRNR